MWSSSGSPATLPRHTAGSSAPVDWDSLLPLLPESVRLLRQVLEDDAALHRLLEHCGGLTLRIPRRFPSEGHLLRALLPEPVLRRLLGAYGGTCLYIPRCARLARQVRQRELLGAFSHQPSPQKSSCGRASTQTALIPHSAIFPISSRKISSASPRIHKNGKI